MAVVIPRTALSSTRPAFGQVRPRAGLLARITAWLAAPGGGSHLRAGGELPAQPMMTSISLGGASFMR